MKISASSSAVTAAACLAALGAVPAASAQSPEIRPPSDLPSHDWCGVARGIRKNLAATPANSATEASQPVGTPPAASGAKLTPDELFSLLSDPNPEHQEFGLSMVPAFTEQAETNSPKLLALLRHPQPSVRGTAARAVGLLRPPGQAGRAAAEALLALLHEPVPVAEDAIWSLGQMGPPAHGRVAAALIDLLPSESLVLRNRTLDSLQAFSPLDPARHAQILTVLPGVFSASWEGDMGTDFYLARLCQRDPALEREVMLTLLRGSEEQRRGALRTLGRLDQPSAEATRLVASHLQAESAVLRRDAREALGRMGPLGAEYLRGARRP